MHHTLSAMSRMCLKAVCVLNANNLWWNDSEVYKLQIWESSLSLDFVVFIRIIKFDDYLLEIQNCLALNDTILILAAYLQLHMIHIYEIIWRHNRVRHKEKFILAKMASDFDFILAKPISYSPIWRVTWFCTRQIQKCIYKQIMYILGFWGLLCKLFFIEIHAKLPH